MQNNFNKLHITQQIVTTKKKRENKTGQNNRIDRPDNETFELKTLLTDTDYGCRAIKLVNSQ